MSPDVTVIVPTRDRPAALGAALRSLADQTLDACRFDVLVVDDAGEADLDPVLAAVRDRLELRRVRGAGHGPAAARNLGIRHSSAPLLAFIDDDCLADPAWLEAVVAAHRNQPDALLGGAIDNALPRSATARAGQVILEQSYAYYAANPGEGRFFASMNMAIPTEGIADVGGFDESFRWSEDRELCDRWRVAGRPLAYVPDARVLHAHRVSVSSFFRQHFGYGRGAYRYHQRRADRVGTFRPAGRFYAGFFPRLLRIRPVSHALALAPLLGVWQLANTSGYLYEAFHALSARSGTTG